MVAGVSTSWFTFVLGSLFTIPAPPTRTEPFTLLITPTGPDSHSLTPQNVPICARREYYGSYGRPLQHVYGLDEDCLSVTFSTLDSGAVSLPLPGPHFGGSDPGKRVLVWLQDAGVDAHLRNGSEFHEDMDTLEKNLQAYRDPLRVIGQVALPTDTPNEGILSFVYRSRSSAIVSVHQALAAHLDKLLPPFIVLVALPTRGRAFTPVPDEAVARVKKVVSPRHSILAENI